MGLGVIKLKSSDVATLPKRERPARTETRARRGYAGAVQHDCIRHDDYRSADFSGPMVAA
jgi:hypothetical protein